MAELETQTVATEVVTPDPAVTQEGNAPAPETIPDVFYGRFKELVGEEFDNDDSVRDWVSSLKAKATEERIAEPRTAFAKKLEDYALAEYEANGRDEEKTMPKFREWMRDQSVDWKQVAQEDPAKVLERRAIERGNTPEQARKLVAYQMKATVPPADADETAIEAAEYAKLTLVNDALEYASVLNQKKESLGVHPSLAKRDAENKEFATKVGEFKEGLGNELRSFKGIKVGDDVVTDGLMDKGKVLPSFIEKVNTVSENPFALLNVLGVYGKDGRFDPKAAIRIMALADANLGKATASIRSDGKAEGQKAVIMEAANSTGKAPVSQPGKENTLTEAQMQEMHRRLSLR